MKLDYKTLFLTFCWFFNFNLLHLKNIFFKRLLIFLLSATFKKQKNNYHY